MNRGSSRQAAAVGIVLMTAAALSAASGTPDELPPSSLGWPPLLHLERAVALIGIVAGAMLVGVRALNGRFPARFAQIE